MVKVAQAGDLCICPSPKQISSHMSRWMETDQTGVGEGPGWFQLMTDSC